MAYPTKSDLQYSYTGFQQSQGDNSFPGTALDNDMANLKASIDATIDFVESSFRSDGVLNASSVPSVTDIAAIANQATAAATSISATVATVTAGAATTAANVTTSQTLLSAAQAAASAAAGSAAAASAASGFDTSNLVFKTANLSDLSNASTARTNLGLGSLATLSTIDVANLTAAVQAMLTPTGKVAHFVLSSAPTGWVAANGGTIGNASSGATARANADTAALFAAIWALDATNFPITTSAGGASTRGASAAVDYAAAKRLPLPDMRGEFMRGLDSSRGVDTSRLLGSFQAEMIGPHSHTGVTDIEPAHTHTVTAYGTGSGAVIGNGATAIQNTLRTTSSAGAHAHSLTIDNNTGTENRVRNVAFLVCIKL